MPDSGDKLYTAAQVRGLDHTAIHQLGIPGYELMQRAGRVVTNAVLKRLPAARHWLILCGPGNNGGDGYVVARLAREAGLDVTVCALSDPQDLRGDAASAWSDWQAGQGQVCAWPMAQERRYDLALDALLGTGISREVSGDYRQAITYLNQLECPKIAIDIPSGLNADSGRVMGCCVAAELTVTFVARKRGMYTADGPDHCGAILFSDLDIPAQVAVAGPDGSLLPEAFLGQVLKPRRRNSHKGSYGHVLAVGGVQGMSGAIRLCGEAALRSGAGRVTLATAPAHADFINLTCPELMVATVTEGRDLEALLGHRPVVAVGPGLGGTAWSQSLFRACLGSGLPLVVDADGLNLLAEAGVGQWLDDRRNRGDRKNRVLTPHPAEAARLLTCSTAEVQQDRFAAVQALAKRYRASVVLKGCGSIVASPDGEYAICPYGNPGMATAGSGDVLTGMIAALMAQGLAAHEAALAGVLAHALAGDLAAAQWGQMALLAGDLLAQLPAVWQTATPSKSRHG